MIEPLFYTGSGVIQIYGYWVSWSEWISILWNLKELKSQMATEAEALQKLTDDYRANKAAVAGALGALKTQITELKTQLAENPNSSEAILDLATQIEQDTADLLASQSPPAPEESGGNVEGA